MKEETLEEYLDKYNKIPENNWDLIRTVEMYKRSHGIEKDSQIYEDAGISKQTWSNAMSGKTHPSVDFYIKICLIMHLNESESKELLFKGGYYLTSSNRRLTIIRYCIANKIYSISEVDDMLRKNGYEPLTKKEY